MSGTSAPRSNAERSANSRRREQRGRRGRDERRRRRDGERDRDGAQPVPGTRRTSGRAIAIRRTKSPTAAITARKTIQRAASSRGVAAVSEIDGMTNCGAGPGVRADREGEGAADRVAVDGDDPPVDEVPALREMLERDDERVRVGRRPPRRAGVSLLAVRVGDGDDREARLDRLAVGERDLRRADCSRRRSPTARS